MFGIFSKSHHLMSETLLVVVGSWNSESCQPENKTSAGDWFAIVGFVGIIYGMSFCYND